MGRWAIRKRLRQMHRLLVDSRSALERAGVGLGNKLLNELLFMLACRRIIMLNLLDHEIGTFGISDKPDLRATEKLVQHLNGNGRARANGLVNACEQEEIYLKEELGELMRQPGLRGHTRQMLSNLLSEVDEDLRDLRFARMNLPTHRI